MSKVMFSLPNQLIVRLRAIIPSGERSELVARFLEEEVNRREKGLYARALELEACGGMRQEMQAWDAEFAQDGLDHV